MRNNPLNFAVVREDPEIEAALVREAGASRVMMVASGGCTALALQSEFPELELTLVDPNPAQLQLVKEKIATLSRSDSDLRDRFNVENDDPGGLCQRGKFESLFRSLRGFVADLVVSPEELGALLRRGPAGDELDQIFAHAYWPVAFELFFSDGLLEAMFGPDATQHAVPGSYPAYFRSRIEEGLRRSDAADNYFLHHIFLGCYVDRAQSLPRYLRAPIQKWKIDLVESTLQQASGLERFDLISLSNIFDWMSTEEASELAARVAQKARPGAVVVWRQLNNDRPVEEAFGSGFEFSAEEGAAMLRKDRSLFYSSIHVGRKRHD